MTLKRFRQSKSAGAARPKSNGRTFQVVKPEQLEALVSTKRHDIIAQLAASGPMSVRELADAIGAAPSSLYYHIEHLCSVGLVLEAGVRQDQNKPEQLYNVPARNMFLFDAMQAPRNKPVMKAIAGAICKQATRDFSRGFDAPHRNPVGATRNVRFGRLVGRPDAATLKRINTHLDAITELLLASTHGTGPRIAMTWVVAPQLGKKAKI